MENSTRLASGMCILIDLPDERIGCYQDQQSNNNNNSNNNCISCSIYGKFITGEGLDDDEDGYGYYSAGHVICIVLAVMTLLVGLSGTFMSSLIITVLRRQDSGKSFDILLTALAAVDFLVCFTSPICTVAMVVFFQNWDRGLVTLVVFLCSFHLALFARSASCFLTVAIAIERFLVVAFPLATYKWFTPWKTKVVAGTMISYAFLTMAALRSSTNHIAKNSFGGVGGSLGGMDYLIYSKIPKYAWLKWGRILSNLVELYVPLPLLLVFNGLTFYQIYKNSNRRQKELNVAVNKELRLGQMFAFVAFVLIMCQIEPLTVYYFAVTRNVVYREGFVGSLLASTINSAANLPIYYLKAEGFKQEARRVLMGWFPCLCRRRTKELDGTFSGRRRNNGRTMITRL